MLDKHTIDNIVWYQVELNENVIDLEVGTICWVGAEAILPTIGWEEFKIQLKKFEKNNPDLSRNELITKARQISHNKDLPFDDIIGSKGGNEYLDTRENDDSKWQFLKDAQKVRMPDGKLVDIYHAFVGLDVLGKKVENQTYYRIGVGQNYSATLFAGDIGAAVTDAVIGKDKDWEETYKIPSDPKKREKHLDTIIDHYYDTRAPESDLLADIDSWGLYNLLENASDDQSLESIFSKFYDDVAYVKNQNNHITANRFNAIKSFYLHYNLTSKTPFAEQREATIKIRNQIFYFSRIWYLRQDNLSFFSPDTWQPLLLTYSEIMAIKFLHWLEKLAEENGIPPPMPNQF